MIPGTRALAFAARWFDASTVANVFEPLVADWQRQWIDSPLSRRPSVWISGASALLLAMTAASPNVLFAPWPAGTLRRCIRRVAIWTTVVSALLLIPFINDLSPKLDLMVSLYLLLLLLPQAIALAFPAAITTVVDVIRTASEPVREERLAAVKFGIGAAALMLLLVGWGFPAANQQFRVAAAQAVAGPTAWPTRGPAPGIRELSLRELANDDSLKSELWVGRESWVSSRAESIRAEIARRTALITLPIVMMWMRWRALRLARGRWFSALPLAASAPVTIVLCYGLLEQSSALADVVLAPRWSGSLLALVAIIVSSTAIDQMRQRVARLARMA